MGPPDAADPTLCVVTKAGVLGEGHGVETELPRPGGPVAGGRGSVSKDRVRRHDARTMEKEAGATGSCVDV